MNQTSVHIVARVTAKPDRVAELRAVLETLLTPTRQEAGCRRYILLQNQQEPTGFTFVEEWVDAAAIDNHMKSAHLQQAFAQAAGLLAARPDIQRYDLIG
ncbi:putative Antibiotic biosynthesis monooxygenase [Candidatus Competibacter denitrificans Run_A_D11]|uniref:Antibiotic biosynthesis monooxygenase n=1 Tax=Candidatus Competibacter denitrificans Run_A_D11 TaxID=1400863 RepID=W6M2P1_9GAMM|nr:putative quinol monooxygenase [Candidatus Competibacter denitrificans]CDI01791.1 putative Antibiotic biosynthesis monooxygenase [Candidatus Competibacter denitrificans Run_A_D11]